ncbi:hypothetical protein [Microbulbifer sp. HZ11]|uniref:hypothetical protein n=1 Tax=Microbulbifer sp. HZ11 TaxID=1453501 RepID=UPI0005BA0AB9|nr:hypothetical protein [Microbulbifer sp. HZ11]
MVIIEKENDLSPRNAFFKSMNDLLLLAGATGDTTFHESTWDLGSKRLVDFRVLDHPDCDYTDSPVLDYKGEKINLTVQEMGKVLWLLIFERTQSVDAIAMRSVKSLALLFSYFKESKTDVVDTSNLSEFYGYLLLKRFTDDGATPSLSAAGPAVIARLGLDGLSRSLKAFGADRPIGSISTIKSRSALDEACRSHLGVTAADYRKGGSFNFLGLDIGKHYIDHCANEFDEHFQFAAAARKTLYTIEDEVKARLGMGNWASIGSVVAQFLLGDTPENFPDVYVKRYFRLSNRDLIYDIFNERFVAIFNSYAHLSCAYKIDVINQIISISGLEQRFDTQEFVRSVVFSLFSGNEVKSAEEIFSEYSSALSANSEMPNLTFPQFKDICLETVGANRVTLTGDRAETSSFCRKQSESICQYSEQDGLRKLKSGLLFVESCGTILLLGLLGWRRSEFGFPLSSIKVERNHDVLDGLYTPFRFHVHWTVPKTSSDTKLDREVTLSTYLIATQLNALNLAEEVKPVAYFDEKKSDRIYRSTEYISRRSDFVWKDFVLNYSFFSSKEQKEFLIGNLPVYEILEDVAGICRSYAKGDLEQKYCRSFEDLLPDEWLRFIKEDSNKLLPEAVAKIRSMLLADLPYPTPHAFRHIWAEAVLRRYRGDVGKFIRANFKHLDESFFMSYLRDKETKAVYSIAKRTVINSIVRQQLHALSSNDHSFAGGFDRFLTRSVRSTKVHSVQDYEKFCQRISEERVIDIKSNPWGTCLLRIGTENSAKCSIDGFPQRQNAEPKFCLGCVNASISEGNFSGIVVYIKPDIDACRNPNLPKFIKEMHIPVVKQALQRVRELSERSRDSCRYEAFIMHMEESIELALNCSPLAFESGVLEYEQ